MADYDALIAEAREDIARSEEILDNFKRGERHWRGPDHLNLEEVTDKHRKIEERRLALAKKRLAAYESMNA